jgi:hypothetical protein
MACICKFHQSLMMQMDQDLFDVGVESCGPVSTFIITKLSAMKKSVRNYFCVER